MSTTLRTPRARKDPGLCKQDRGLATHQNHLEDDMQHDTAPDRDVDALQRVLPLIVEQILRAHGAFDATVAAVGTEIALMWPTADPREADLIYRWSAIVDGERSAHGWSTLTIPLRGA